MEKKKYDEEIASLKKELATAQRKGAQGAQEGAQGAQSVQGAHILPSISAAANAAVNTSADGSSSIEATTTTAGGSTTTSISHSQPSGSGFDGMEFEGFDGYQLVEPTKKRIAHTRLRSPPKDKKNKMQRIALSRGSNSQHSS